MSSRIRKIRSSKSGSYVGAPAIFNLSNACRLITQAFPGSQCWLVGSAMTRPDWRDVDVRCIMTQEEMKAHLGCTDYGSTDHVPKLTLMAVSISAWLQQQTGLPVDFQFQSTFRSKFEDKKPRMILGMWLIEDQRAKVIMDDV